MGASLNELFADAATAQPATADSYGIRPPAYRLPDATRISGVTLQVSDLATSRAYYEQILGFHPITIATERVTLAARDSDDVLVTLIEQRASEGLTNERRTPRKSLGLYHFAILLPTRGDLGRFLSHLEQRGVRAGASDHVVSEALYLQDPDDLGIEVYVDRPRSAWRRTGAQLVMATDPLDARSLLAAGGNDAWRGMPSGTTIGHVHLHVGDLTAASRFYSDAIGFDRMVWAYPSALFLGAGGYHHHLGTNTWAGPNAKPAETDDPQLLEWTLELPTRADVEAVTASLHGLGYAAHASRDMGDVMTQDPWGTALRIIAPSPDHAATHSGIEPDVHGPAA